MVIHPEEALLELARVLEAADVAYAVGGSIASGHHGEIRATNDIDVLVELGPRGLRALQDALGSAWHIDGEAAAHAASEGGSFSMLHLASMVKVDVFVATEARLDRLQLGRRVPVELGPSGARVVDFTSPEDVILRKLDWFRRSDEVLERQLRDVAGVLKAGGSTLDRAYLRAAAASLGLGALLERALGEAGLEDTRP